MRALTGFSHAWRGNEARRMRALPTGLKMRMMRILIFLLIASSAQAATYHRFWRGTKLPALSARQFVGELNATFLPATVKTGAGQGLIAYEPVLPALRSLPDEIALVSYEDQAAYDALMATPAGKAYVALHWQLFAQAESASVVPAPYQGTVALGGAYDLDPAYAGWQSHRTVVLVGFRDPGESDAAYLSRFQAELESKGPLDRVALISDAYWLDYVSTDSRRGARAAASEGAALVLSLRSGGLGAVRLSPGRGVNLRFSP